MNRVAKWIMRLYPATWRARYGDELDALLSDTGADARVMTDLLKGGIRMQIKAWSFPALAVTLGIAGALLGTGISLLLPSQYTSKATLQVTPTQISEAEPASSVQAQLDEQIQKAETHVLRRTSLARIIWSPQLTFYADEHPQLTLYTDERKTTPLEDVIEEMRRNIDIRFVRLPGSLGTRAAAFDILFTYRDAIKAQETVQTLLAQFQSELEKKPDLMLSLSGVPNSALPEVVDSASLPVYPIYPERPVAMLAGFVLGVLLASIWRLTRRTGFIARRFPLVALAFGLVGWVAVIVAGDGYQILPFQYRSTATLQVPQGTRPDQISALQTATFGYSGLSVVIMDPRLNLYKDLRATTPLQSVIQTMKHHLKVTLPNSPHPASFSISFDYPDRFKAQRTLQTLVYTLFEVYRRLHPNAALPAQDTPVVVDILDAASLPVSPTSPNRYRHAVFGGFWGVVAAALIALVRRRWEPETHLPVNAANA
jgi:LPS O-antigen subunit length determinant protein (WzzB/FepE family)